MIHCPWGLLSGRQQDQDSNDSQWGLPSGQQQDQDSNDSQWGLPSGQQQDQDSNDSQWGLPSGQQHDYGIYYQDNNMTLSMGSAIRTLSMGSAIRTLSMGSAIRTLSMGSAISPWGLLSGQQSMGSAVHGVCYQCHRTLGRMPHPLPVPVTAYMVPHTPPRTTLTLLCTCDTIHSVHATPHSCRGNITICHAPIDHLVGTLLTSGTHVGHSLLVIFIVLLKEEDGGRMGGGRGGDKSKIIKLRASPSASVSRVLGTEHGDGPKDKRYLSSLALVPNPSP